MCDTQTDVRDTQTDVCETQTDVRDTQTVGQTQTDGQTQTASREQFGFDHDCIATPTVAEAMQTISLLRQYTQPHTHALPQWS